MKETSMFNALEPWGRTRGGISVLVASLAASCAAPAAEPTPADLAWLDGAGTLDLGGSVLVIHSAGVDELLSDPRDAGLREALALLDERLLELPGELGRAAAPPGTIEFLCEALCASWTLRVDLDAPGMFGIRAQWTVRPASAERASALAARFAGLMESIGLSSTPAQHEPTLSEVALPFGSLFHGASKDGSSFLIGWGAPEAETLDLATAGLPGDVRPSFGFGLDYGAFMDALRRLAPADDPEAKELEALLAGLGMGSGASRRVTAAGGQGARGLQLVSRDAGWVPAAEAIGALAAGPIPAAALGLVPDDATLVSIARLEPGALARVFALLGGEAAETLARLHAALGVELGPDLLEPLGQTFGFYLSDTTGGSDLASAVAFADVDDPERLAATLATLAARVNALGESAGKGRVRALPFEHAGARGFELVFPGLPVPIRPALALHDGHLVAAATPQALASALDWASRALADTYFLGWSWRMHLAPASVGVLDDVQSLFYLDTPRLARQGYGMASLLAAAIANGLRSPADPARDTGSVLPPLRELLQGSHPAVFLARIRGQDRVSAGSMDGSASAQLAAVMGFAPALTSGVLLAGTLATLLGPDAAEELEDDDVIAAQDDIWMILDALEGHASEHDGRYPDSLEALLEVDEEGLSWMVEIPLDPWGNAYVYEHDGESVRVLSLGADGVPGGEGLDADVSSDDLGYYESWEDDEGWIELDEPEEESAEPED
jgi:general secretion pathway protein G